jgi:predicted dehydrogenase
VSVRWGVVGTGRVARQLLRAVDAVDEHEVVGVAGRTRVRAAEFLGEATSAALAAGSVAELLSRAEPELLYVASPNDRHARHIAEGSAAGVPVLCEKPLAADVAACLRIRAVVAAASIPVGVAFQYRHHPAHRRARDVIAAGALGELRLVEVSACLPTLDVPEWCDDPSLAGGGILPMSGVHRVDLVRFLTGAELTAVVRSTTRWASARRSGATQPRRSRSASTHRPVTTGSPCTEQRVPWYSRAP